MSQLSTDMQKFLRQEFGIEAESFLTDTAKEYRVEITEFRKHINSYCDNLISRADSSLKASQKVATKKKLRDVCRWLKDLSDNDVLETMFASKTSADDIVEANQKLRDRGLLSRREYREGINQNIARLSPFEGYRREIKIIESLIISKERILIQKTEALPRISWENNWIKVTNIPKQFDQFIQEARMDVARPPAEKVARMTTRVNTLLMRTLDAESRYELGQITQKLNAIGSQNIELGDACIRLQGRINQKLEEISVSMDDNKSQITIQQQSNPTLANEIETFPDNIHASQYISHLLWVLNHELSSTKHNGYSTHGDGSFVTKTFRQFLQALRNQILPHNQINAKHTSWSEIVQVYQASVDDVDQARVHFLWILKKSTILGTLSDIFREPLLWAIEEFSGSNLYKEHKPALVNVLEALRNNPPPSR